LEYDEGWEAYFEKLPPDIQKRFFKRREKYRTFPPFGFRHERHGAGYLVDEMGQYRVLFVSSENSRVRKFYFIGTIKSMKNSWEPGSRFRVGFFRAYLKGCS